MISLSIWEFGLVLFLVIIATVATCFIYFPKVSRFYQKVQHQKLHYQRRINRYLDEIEHPEKKEERLRSEKAWLMAQAKKVVFKDFKASPKPDIEPPLCPACSKPLYWKPDKYSFTGGDPCTFIVPEMGWWKCRDGHPGMLYRPDLLRYVNMADEYYIQNKDKYPGKARGALKRREEKNNLELSKQGT